MSEIIREKIGENIEILIEGLPKAKITPDVQAKVALALVRNGIPMVGTISAGILGGVRTAVLKIGGESYKIKYSIRVLKVLTALEIYDEAIQWIKFQKQNNRVDPDLADQAIEYLRSEFNREFPGRK